MESLPVAPTLELLARARVRVEAPVEIGRVLVGKRRVVRLLEGRFDGERLRGEILPGGTDWQVWCADGTAFLEARYVVRTDDGALISVHNRGIRHGPADVLAGSAAESRSTPRATTSARRPSARRATSATTG